MKTFFDPKVQVELLGRLQDLEPDAAARWGRMNAAQMLAHCVEGMKMATGELEVGWVPAALIGWMFKRIAYNDTPFSRNAPTAKELKVADERAFEVEKAHFLVGYLHLSKGPDTLGKRRHPFFGTLTTDQWGKLLFKHLDHHFRQFGV